ncbi:MAG: hypothetical protein J6P05_02100 [Lachnospiraceae bacterium]|nr:hypothetical protein [Lachnospiraceae bacterium]
MHVVRNNGKKHLLYMLNRYADKGVDIYVANRYMTPRSTANKVMDSASRYMADFVMDDSGAVKEIRYDRIRP